MSGLESAFLVRLDSIAAAIGNAIHLVIARAVGAAAHEIKLHAVHDFHGIGIMRIIVNAFLETLFHGPSHFIPENVPSNASCDLDDKQRSQQNPKRKQHAVALFKCAAAAEERNNRDGSSHDHNHDRHVPETLIDEAGIVVVVQLVLNDAPEDQRRQSS